MPLSLTSRRTQQVCIFMHVHPHTHMHTHIPLGTTSQFRSLQLHLGSQPLICYQKHSFLTLKQSSGKSSSVDREAKEATAPCRFTVPQGTKVLIAEEKMVEEGQAREMAVVEA